MRECPVGYSTASVFAPASSKSSTTGTQSAFGQTGSFGSDSVAAQMADPSGVPPQTFFASSGAPCFSSAFTVLISPLAAAQ